MVFHSPSPFPNNLSSLNSTHQQSQVMSLLLCSSSTERPLLTMEHQQGTARATCPLPYRPLRNETPLSTPQQVFQSSDCYESSPLLPLLARGQTADKKEQQGLPQRTAEPPNAFCRRHCTGQRFWGRETKPACVSLGLLIHIFSLPRQTAHRVSALPNWRK